MPRDSYSTFEVLIWAGAYVALSAIAALEEAVYFSIVTFTTVGYGDVVLPRDWRILGASEAAAEILLFGWSIALLIVLIQRTMKELILDAKHNHLVQCCWLIILFAGYGFIAARNATVMVLLFACTLSVSGGVFLIQDWRSLSGIDPGVERAVARRDYSTRSINRYRASRHVRDEGEG